MSLSSENAWELMNKFTLRHLVDVAKGDDQPLQLTGRTAEGWPFVLTVLVGRPENQLVTPQLVKESCLERTWADERHP